MREFFPISAEIEIMGTYYPPLLIDGALGTIAMVLTLWLLLRYRLTRYFFFPNVVMLALVIIYTAIIGTFVIPL